MLKVTHRFFIALAFFLSIAWLPAQQNGNSEIRTQDIYAALLEDQPMKAQLYYRNPSGEFKPFNVRLSNRGRANTQRFSNQLVLYAKDVDEFGEEVMRPVRTFDLPNSERILILFYGQEDGSMGYRILDDSKNAHPANTGRIVNLTPLNAACKIDEQQFVVPPWQEKLSAPLTNAQKQFSFGFVLEEEGNYQEFPTMRRYRFAKPDMRMLAAFTYYTHVEELANGDTIETRLPRAFYMRDSLGASARRPVQQFN